MSSSLALFIKSLNRQETLLPLLKRHLIREEQEIEVGMYGHDDVVMRDADQTIACFTARKKEYNHRTRLDGDYFHPSQIGGCLRAMFFAEMGAPTDGMQTADELLKQAFVFEFGTYVHVLVQNLCERAKVLVQREVAIQDAKLRILGHADGILLIKNVKYLLEIKTINARGFAALCEVKDGHKKQIHAYMKSLGLEAAIVLYVNKDTSEMREFVVNYSSSYYEQEVAKRIDYYFERKAKKILPDREGHSPHRMPCSYCAFQKICFDSVATSKWITTI